MKQLFFFIFLVFFYCNAVFAEKVTLGFVGDSCKEFNKGKKKFGKEFEDLVVSEMMGFLTGINIYIADRDGNTNRVKLLSHNSTDYIYNNIVEYCRKKPDDYVFFGLIDYYESLPKPN